MIRAVIFDCFGVLASDGWLPFRDGYFTNKPELYRQAITLNKSFDSGQMTYDEFVQQVSSLAGVEEQTVRDAVEDNLPNTELISYIRDTIKPFYKLGFLSNAGENWLERIFQPEDIAMFDAIALSCETGVIKPKAEAYNIIAQRLGVELKECVFIDDQQKNCDAARTAGMKVIHYTDRAQTKATLKELLRPLVVDGTCDCC